MQNNQASIATSTVTPIVEVVTAECKNKNYTLWADGSMSIENFLYQYLKEDKMDHAMLTRDQVRGLRAFLNSDIVTNLI